MDKKSKPLGNGRNGRNPDGTFAVGCPGGPGNPLMKQTHAWRKALSETFTDKDIQSVAAVLLKKALAGESWAVREFFDRTLGKPKQSIEAEINGSNSLYSAFQGKLDEIRARKRAKREAKAE